MFSMGVLIMYMFNEYNPMFINPDSKSVWVFIVDGVHKRRVESTHIMDDEKVKWLNDNAWEEWKEGRL